MGDWTSWTYIVSQILMLIGYVFIGLSYIEKKRSRLLVLLICSSIAMGIGFGFLSAWTGFGVCMVGIVRDSVNYLVDKKRTDPKKITGPDYFLLVLWLVAYVVIALLTETGIYTWFAMISMVIYAVSVWQRNVFIYRVLGIFVAIFWMLYCVYEQNLVGVIFETCLFIASIIGIFLYIKNNKKAAETKITA